jgi:DNA replication protein DnaC
MSNQRRSTTIHMDEALPDLPPPERVVDLDIVGAEYKRKALRDAAISLWKYHCPLDMVETDWKDPRIVAHAAKHARILGWQNNPLGILASGPTGRGKSRAMWALMRRLAEEGYDIRYFTGASFFAALQNEIRFGREDVLGYITTLAERQIVFIDDFGQEAILASKQDWCEGWFFQFVAVRLGNRLPLFTTTNLGMNEIAAEMAANRANPFVRRLFEGSEVIKFFDSHP